jgi:hypothetical protein
MASAFWSQGFSHAVVEVEKVHNEQLGQGELVIHGFINTASFWTGYPMSKDSICVMTVGETSS